jgi:hypothetical protein
VIKANRMKVGDIFAKQIKGIAMGVSPSPPIANTFAAIFKNRKIIFTFKEVIDLLQRIIDDGFGVRKDHPNMAIDYEQ